MVGRVGEGVKTVMVSWWGGGEDSDGVMVVGDEDSDGVVMVGVREDVNGVEKAQVLVE